MRGSPALFSTPQLPMLHLFVLVVSLAASGAMSMRAVDRCPQPADPQKKLADGCRHVYIDMGTNIGHQIRKLYEPQLYLGNPTEKLFSRFFGGERRHVCVFGFEANPVHEPRLQRLEKALRRHAFRVRIYTSTAVSTEYGNVSFFRDLGGANRNEWGSSLANRKKISKNSMIVTVAAVDMACWMKQEIIGRRIPGDGSGGDGGGRSSSRSSVDTGPGVSSNELPPAVLMKSDIEGYDMKVLSHLIMEGVWCHISHVYGEHMATDWIKAVQMVTNSANCTTEVKHMDDETGDDCLPLPGATAAEMPAPGKKCGDKRLGAHRIRSRAPGV